VEDYIKDSAPKTQESFSEKYLFNVPVFILEPFINDINLDLVIHKIEAVLPREFVRNVEALYIGRFDHLDDRDVNAAYKDGVIYLTNVQDDEEDIVDDIVHELAHVVEEMYGMKLYTDGRIEGEFLGKRKRLFDLLKAAGYDVSIEAFANPEYSRAFDEFLYKEIGYPALMSISAGLFISPYAITSVNEYFANGFEAYFLKNDKKHLINLSPQLYYKIEQIIENINLNRE
jgi:hypothetical protein